MLVGSFNYSLSSASLDGKGGSGVASPFDISLFDPLAKDADKAKDAEADVRAEKDALRRANDAVAREFLDWQQKSPAEKIRERILGARDLDEDSLKALPPAERDAIEAEIRAALKLQLGVEDDGGAGDNGEPRRSTVSAR
jgi:hypothetical protein